PAETLLRLNTSFQSSIGNLVSLPYRNVAYPWLCMQQQGTLLCESRSSPVSTNRAFSAATRSRTLACGRMTRPKTW
ncbi:hypothetical protein CPAR01_11639, partial [Colletotrichum paranaense]